MVALERAAPLASNAGRDIAKRIAREQVDALSWDPTPRQFDFFRCRGKIVWPVRIWPGIG